MNATHPILVTNAARMARGRGGPAPPPPGRFLKEGAIRAAAGFTLVEVLLAIGIFLIGIVAIATVFPTGIAVQREAVDDMTTQLIANNAKQEMVATALSGIDESDPLTYLHDPDKAKREGTLAPFTHDTTPTPGTVQALVPMKANPVYAFGGPAGGSLPIPQMPSGTTPKGANTDAIRDALPLAMRSYPDTVTRVNFRDYFWYPFIQSSAAVNQPSTANARWQGFVIILRRRGASPPPPPPQVRYVTATSAMTNTSNPRFNFKTPGSGFNTNPDGTPAYIQPGDYVLASDGIVYKVVFTDKDGITVNPAPLNDNQDYRLYFGVNVDSDGKPLPGGHSPTLRIEAFGLPIQTPKP